MLLTADGQAVDGQAADGRPGAGRAADGWPGAGRGMLDVRGLIEPLGAARITVSCPATPVLLPAVTAAALAGAVTAALDNVVRHAGPDARAWVLVEDEGSQVRVSIRDDGTGFGDGRLAAAAAEGRLGVSHSIVGRLRDVGGTACLTSSPGLGTEVELRVGRT
jgi:signal transduction histidine kinase